MAKAKNKHVEVVYADVTPYYSREYVKELGWSALRAGKANNMPELEVIGMKLVMYMHYEKSLECFVIPEKAPLHPNFKGYAAAYLAQPDKETWVSKEAMLLLHKEFPPKPHPQLPNGRSEWSSKPNPTAY